MLHLNIGESSQILSQFQQCTQTNYSGQLNFQSSQGNRWSFYYQMGQIVWATGGTHPGRRWYRNMAQICPQINLNKIRLKPEGKSIEYWDYRCLEILLKQNKIQQPQVNAIVENTVAELLFDLAQNINLRTLTCTQHPDIIIEAPISSTSANISLQQMQITWNSWVEAGLATVSPDLAPVLRKPSQLQQQINPTVYKKLEQLINGKHTLWDLAVKMKQSVLSVTRSLLPYIRDGITELVEVPDMPLADKSHSKPRPNAPLIACVDDSPQICRLLEEIVGFNGLRFLKVEDPVQALSILIQNKPDLIFLDLIMPIVNGYELCTQLRRSQSFAETPIIILTGSGGLFDQARSKVYGATEFIKKPVKTEQVIEVINKHLSQSSGTNVQNFSNVGFNYS